MFIVVLEVMDGAVVDGVNNGGEDRVVGTLVGIFCVVSMQKCIERGRGERDKFPRVFTVDFSISFLLYDVGGFWRGKKQRKGFREPCIDKTRD